MEFNARRVLCPVLIALMTITALPLHADPADLKELDETVFKRLRSKSSEHTDITLDGSLLKLAASAISLSGDEDAAKIRRLVASLTSITVRNFEFKNRGDYSVSDLDAIRSQIKLADWTRIVDTAKKDDSERSEIYILPGKDRPQGLFVLTAEPTELTVVHIMGSFDAKDVASLAHLHIGDDEDSK